MKTASSLCRADLGPHQQLLVLAVDADNTASRHLALADVKNDFLDLRLAKTLDPQQHFTQQKQISVLKAGGQLEIADITTPGSRPTTVWPGCTRCTPRSAATLGWPSLRL